MKNRRTALPVHWINLLYAHVMVAENRQQKRASIGRMLGFAMNAMTGKVRTTMIGTVRLVNDLFCGQRVPVLWHSDVTVC